MISDLLYRLRALFRRGAAEADMEEELRYHLDRLPDRTARVAFGGADQIREECRDARGTRWIEDLARDARYALRTFRQSPVFAFVAVFSLALGIGANTAIFTVLDAVMLRTLPVREPSQLVALTMGKADNDVFTYLIFDEIRRRQDVFSSVFAYSQEDRFDLSAGGEKQPARGLYVSGDYFSALGVSAQLGRVLTEADDRPGAPPAAVLSYAFWQRHYNGDPDIVGRTIRLDNHLFAIAGVAPRGFFGMDVGEQFDVAVPLQSAAIFDNGPARLTRPLYWWLNVAARLKPGITPSQAEARLKVLGPGIFQAAVPRPGKRELGLKSASVGYSYVRSQYGKPLVLIMGMVGLVLLVACANVANLLLARTSARVREIAVRLAIGAGRGRVIRQLLTESLTLSIGGAAAGLALAQWGSRVLVASISTTRDTRFIDVSLDVRVLLFTTAIAITTGLLFGLAPAVRAARSTPSESLKDRSRAAAGGAKRGFSRALVSAQVALSLVLITGAGLFIRSLHQLTSEDPGFRAGNVLLVEARLRGTAAAQFETRLRDVPGVLAVGRSAETPMGGGTWQWDIAKVHCWFNLVSPGYFQTIGTPLLAGRDFAAQDDQAAPRVAIVNRSAARLLFPGKDPIGQTYRDYKLTSTGENGAEFPVEVVGLVKDAKYRRLRDVAPPTVYLPIAQNPADRPVIGTYELRFAGPLASITAGVKDAAQDVDPRIGLEFRLLSTQIADSLLQERLLAKLAGFFGVLALVIASVGLYGVVAYAVMRRRNEIGIRMALGASSGSVVRLVLREVAWLVIAGLPAGIAAVLACGKLVRTMLYGLAPNDAATIAMACALLVSVAVIAGYLPARRAAGLDPLTTLREE